MKKVKILLSSGHDYTVDIEDDQFLIIMQAIEAQSNYIIDVKVSTAKKRLITSAKYVVAVVVEA